MNSDFLQIRLKDMLEEIGEEETQKYLSSFKRKHRLQIGILRQCETRNSECPDHWNW